MGGVASTFAPAGSLWGSLYGAGTGSVIGGVGSVMTGGDIKEGIIFGAATGLVGGGIQGYCSAKSQGLNPWTGAKLPETTVNTPNVPFEVQAETVVAEKATTGGDGSYSESTQHWTSTNKISSVKNAYAHWQKHGTEFPEFLNAKQYVEGANNFLHNSPTGTLVKIRVNGDILKYNPGTNTFGVMDVNGVPRTLFRPNGGMEYWLKQ